MCGARDLPPATSSSISCLRGAWWLGLSIIVRVSDKVSICWGLLLEGPSSSIRTQSTQFTCRSHLVTYHAKAQTQT